MKPHDPLLVLVWLGRALNGVVKDDQNEFFKMVKVQWWCNPKIGYIHFWMSLIKEVVGSV